jgi:hypothetical protein
MDRAYSLLTIKAVDEEQRIIRGIATTPSTDRMEDVVEPLGGEFTLPIPFLWQHESWESAIGEVFAAKATPQGIPVEIRVEKDDVPGLLKDRLDYAWRSILKKLVRGLSIGFMPIEEEPIPGSWGTRYIRWGWYELSAVTIPANAEATILAVKSLDCHGAASGARATPPGASGTVKSIKSQPGALQVQTTLEQIKDFEATRAAKSARMDELMAKAAEAGTTLDAPQEEEFDGLEREVESVDKHLVRLRSQEARNKAAAKPVDGRTTEDASNSRAGIVVVKDHVLPPGIRFARVARCKALAARYNLNVERVAAERYPDDGIVAKAVSAGSTNDYDNTWASPLVGTETTFFADFVEFLMPQTILGKFGANGIPSLHAVPFRTALIEETAGMDGFWVGEGKAKPLTSSGFRRRTLEPLKVANIAVVTDELLRGSSPSADTLIRNALANALRKRLDLDFVNPDKAAEGGVSPDSITHDVTPIPSEGNDADSVRHDIVALVNAFGDLKNNLSGGVFILDTKTALNLSIMRNPLGQREFDGLTMRGGTLEGFPAIVSDFVPSDSDGSIVVMLSAGDIYFADEGGIAVDISTQASLEMSATPSMDSTTPTPATSVSLWQTNSVGFRAERIINWMKRRDEAVQYLSAVNWGAASS